MGGVGLRGDLEREGAVGSKGGDMWVGVSAGSPPASEDRETEKWRPGPGGQGIQVGGEDRPEDR